MLLKVKTCYDYKQPFKIHVYKNPCMFEIQVENHSKIVNYKQIQKPRTSKSEIYITWRGKIQNMLDITIKQ